MAAIRARHGAAARAARAGAAILTGREWVGAAQASNLVTAAALPPELDAAQILAAAAPGHALSAGVGPNGDRLIRLNHTGPRARLETVLADLSALGRALRQAGHAADTAAALGAAEAAFHP